MKRFLINKTSSIGDVIQTFPVLAYLKSKYPDSEVDWVVEKGIANFLRSIPSINRVIEVDTKKWRKSLFALSTWKEIGKIKRLLGSIEYEAVFDLQGNSKSAVWTFFAHSKHKVGYGFKDCPERLNLLVTNHKIDISSTSIQDRYLKLVQSYLGDIERFDFQGVEVIVPKEEEEAVNEFFYKEGLRGKVVLITPFSRWKNKELDDAVLADFIFRASGENDIPFVMSVSNPEEEKRAALIQQTAKDLKIIHSKSLTMWLAIMKKCCLVLSVDSAGVHLAAAVGIPTFSLFGPSNEEVYRPIGDRHRSFQGYCPYEARFQKRCSKLRTCPTGACMKSSSLSLWYEKFLDFYRKL